MHAAQPNGLVGGQKDTYSKQEPMSRAGHECTMAHWQQPAPDENGEPAAPPLSLSEDLKAQDTHVGCTAQACGILQERHVRVRLDQEGTQTLLLPADTSTVQREHTQPLQRRVLGSC